NRVANIGSVAEHLGKLVPQAVVAVAHGQMGEDALENVMMDFISGAIDVLVCTTIIESGLDIPNVNTIIIQDADKMGLSQLYQLRGRVGRSARTSFAFLTYQRDKILTEVAERRLSAIREFTEFGAGFKIAMRDLEIRGAGNLLGSAQHGHMDAVGYEMYCRLLDDTIKSMQGIDVPQKFDTLMEINIDAFIPNNYIPSELQKLEIYKRISHITNQQDFYDVQEEMEDRFGTLPKSAANLLDIALLKANANDIGVVSITQKSLRIIITFKPDAPINPAAITDVVGKSAGRLKLTIGQNPFITFRIKDEHENFMPELMRTILSIREKSESRGE
ncbi:MAG: transcription-repair coupling factor, partial [Defluviitaleaceae bacterium]|nr:transcription-repair coupling factor [Defluviitaleaceae bacterium]